MSIAHCPIRRGSITATEMATLFGLNPYSSPKKMLEQKLNPQPIMNNHVRRGKLMEPAVLEAILLDTGMETRRHNGGTLRLDEHRISATPDAYDMEGNVVEAKSISQHSFEKWYTVIPTNYHIQVHVQMLVTGATKGYIAALEAGHPSECEFRLAFWEVTRDSTIEDLMKSEVRRFWEAVDSGNLFRVNSLMKKSMSTKLEASSRRVYPIDDPVRKTNEEKLFDVLTIFD